MMAQNPSRIDLYKRYQEIIAAYIDHMLQGMPDDFSNEDIEVRAEIIYQYVNV